MRPISLFRGTKGELKLSGFEYLKYYLLQLYYIWYEYPPVVRSWSIFVSLSLIFIIVIFIRLYFMAQKEANQKYHNIKYNRQYYDKIQAVALSNERKEVDQIAEEIGLPSNYKMHRNKTKYFVPILMDIYAKNKDAINKKNWKNITLALKMPAFFEAQFRSRSLFTRISTLKNVSDTNTDLKEAAASRYLFAKDEKLRMSSRLHAARYGTSYPFKVLEEDPHLYVSEEMMVKLHNVLTYRIENDLSIPNLIHWCTLYPINESLRLFAVNEIRLLKQYKNCKELLELLVDSTDEKFSIEAIKTLGELKYIQAEPEFLRRYTYASNAERKALGDALGNIKSGNPEVIECLLKDYDDVTEAVAKVHVLKVLHDYGPAGLKAYNELKSKCSEDDKRFFDHIECELLDSSRYA